MSNVAKRLWKEQDTFLDENWILPGVVEGVVKFAPRLLFSFSKKLSGQWNRVIKDGWGNLGPRFLGPVYERGSINAAIGKKIWICPATVSSSTKIVLRKRKGKARGEIKLRMYARSGAIVHKEDYTFPPSPQSRTKTFTFPKDKFGIVLVEIKSKSIVPTKKFAYEIKYELSRSELAQKPVKGFADLHVHQMAEHSFHGKWLHGKHKGDPAEALCSCGTIGGKLFALFMKLRDEKENAQDIRHGSGYPDFANWPHHMDFAHQQVHSDWLRQAHKNGMSLIVACAVNNELLASLMRAVNGQKGQSIRDMPTLEKQIDAIHAFAEENSDWYQIAYTPWHAREIIHSGKMAVVISVEASNIFPSDGDYYLDQLDRLYAKGVRCAQIVHLTDNQFAGVAPQKKELDAVHTASKLANLSAITDLKLKPRLEKKNGKNEWERKNVKGLTKRGKRLINAMMDRHMLIDAAHYSDKTLRDVYAIAKERGKYPIINTHAKFNDLLPVSLKKSEREFVITKTQLGIYRDTGGMIGIRTAPWVLKKAKTSGFTNEIDKDKGGIGTARSVAQQVMYAFDNDVDIAFGSDINGFTNQVGPRAEGSKPPKVGAEYWKSGLKHIGMLPDLLEDLKSMKTPGAEELDSSSETFIQVWERAWNIRHRPEEDLIA